MAGATGTRITPSHLPKGRDAGPGFRVRMSLQVRLPGEVLGFSSQGYPSSDTGDPAWE